MAALAVSVGITTAEASNAAVELADKLAEEIGETLIKVPGETVHRPATE